jgi:hypothetical protein
MSLVWWTCPATGTAKSGNYPFAQVRNKELYLVEKNHHEQLEDETAATIPSIRPNMVRGSTNSPSFFQGSNVWTNDRK